MYNKQQVITYIDKFLDLHDNVEGNESIESIKDNYESVNDMLHMIEDFVMSDDANASLKESYFMIKRSNDEKYSINTTLRSLNRALDILSNKKQKLERKKENDTATNDMFQLKTKVQNLSQTEQSKVELEKDLQTRQNYVQVAIDTNRKFFDESKLLQSEKLSAKKQKKLQGDIDKYSNEYLQLLAELETIKSSLKTVEQEKIDIHNDVQQIENEISLKKAQLNQSITVSEDSDDIENNISILRDDIERSNFILSEVKKLESEYSVILKKELCRFRDEQLSSESKQDDSDVKSNTNPVCQQIQENVSSTVTHDNDDVKLDDLNSEAEALFTNINDILNRYNDKIKSESPNKTLSQTGQDVTGATKELPRQAVPLEKPGLYKQSAATIPFKIDRLSYKGTGGKSIEKIIAPQHLQSLFYNTNVKLTRGQLVSTTWGFISFILFAFSVYTTQYMMKRLSEYRESIANTGYNFAMVLLCLYTGILSVFALIVGSWKAFWVFLIMFLLIVIAFYFTVFVSPNSHPNPEKNEK